MVKPTPPTAPEAPLRSDPAFSTKAQTFLTWLAGGFNTYVEDAVDYVDERADEALAAATTFGFPSIAGKGLNFTRVNAGGTALEFRTPAQVRADLGLPDIIAQGTLSGSELIIAIPSAFEGIDLSYWNYQPSAAAASLRMAIGSGTIGSPTWAASHFEQIQSVLNLTYTPSNVGPLGFVNLSFDQLGPGNSQGAGRAIANGFNVAGAVYGETLRRGVVGGGQQRATSTGSFAEESAVVHTLIRIFVSAGTMSGSYRLLGYRKP
jgi:hypothetical protein